MYIERLRCLEPRMQMAMFGEAKHSRVLLGQQEPMRRHLKKTLDIRVFQLVEGRHLCKFAAKNRLRGYYLACSSGLTNKKADVRILPESRKSSFLAASLNEAKCVTVGKQKCRRCAWTTWQQACHIRSLRFEDSGLAVAHTDKIQPSIAIGQSDQKPPWRKSKCDVGYGATQTTSLHHASARLTSALPTKTQQPLTFSLLRCAQRFSAG